MTPTSKVITVPQMELNLDQFLAIIRQLDGSTRAEVARVLAEDQDGRELCGADRTVGTGPRKRRTSATRKSRRRSRLLAGKADSSAMQKIVVDTNIWIRALLGGRATRAGPPGLAGRQV